MIPPGDPCVHRFREEVAQGAIPFRRAGPGKCVVPRWWRRTIGWEMADAEGTHQQSTSDRFFIQVGGGAFAACAATGLFAGGIRPRLHAVQAHGCARHWPRAWSWPEQVVACAMQVAAGPSACGRGSSSRLHCRWNIDDETYDWIAVCNAMADGGGSPVVASEQHIIEAYALAHRVTTIDASAQLVRRALPECWPYVTRSPTMSGWPLYFSGACGQFHIATRIVRPRADDAQ